MSTELGAPTGIIPGFISGRRGRSAGSLGTPRKGQRPRGGGSRKTRLRKNFQTRTKQARFRTRVEPNPYSGIMAGLSTGGIFVEDGPGSERWVPYGSRRNDWLSYPYVSMESCADELHGHSPWKVGGPFRKIEIGPVVPFSMQGFGTYITSGVWNMYPYLGRVKYVGGFAPPDPFPGSGELNLPLKDLLGPTSLLVGNTSTLEAQTWSRTKPPIEHGGLFVALREGKEIPSMLKTSAHGFLDIYKKLGGNQSSRILQPKKVADHFLNHNFGWVPFVKDVVGTLDNIINHEEKIRKISDRNGKDIRRRVPFFDSTETTILGGDNVCLVSPGNIAFLQNCMVGQPHYEVSLERRFEAHGVGRFRYYLDYFDDGNLYSKGVIGALRRELALHGARISPANLYKSTPWTWLIDWFTNTGRTISAINDELVDNMAATYLYLCHTEEKTYRFKQFLPFNAASGGTKVVEWTRHINVRQRKEATAPFGFGLSWEELSSKQLALLGALGITRR